MQIREIREADLADLRQLYIALCEKDIGLESMTQAFQRVKKNADYHLLGAEVDGKIVGTLMGIVCYDVAGDGFDFMTIENVIVDENYRGHGICKALFGEMEEIARANHCAYIYLVSGEKRKAAHQLYRQLGYDKEHAKGFRKYL